MYEYCNMGWDRRLGGGFPEYLFFGNSQNKENSPFTPMDLASPRPNHSRVQPPLPVLASVRESVQTDDATMHPVVQRY